MLTLKNVTKRYGSFVAVKEVSFTVPQGSIYGLVGYNGAGKTTLLKTIAGVYLPDEGSITMDGHSVHSGLGPWHSPFIVADEPYFLPQATPNLMRSFYRGYYPTWDDGVYERLLNLFKLDPQARIGEFSKGMQKQTVLALALATGSRCLLLDESFDGLDLGRRNLFKRLFRRYATEREAVIILSSHNLRELEDAVDRIGMIKERRLTFDLTVKEMHQRYQKYRLQVPDNKDSAAIHDLLTNSPAVRWMQFEENTCTFFVDTWTEDIVLRLNEAGMPAPETLEATLEEIFLDKEEVDPVGLEGIFG